MSGYVATFIGSDHGTAPSDKDITVPANCNLVLVGIGTNGNFSTTSVTLGGVAMTQVPNTKATDIGSGCIMFYSINKAPGVHTLHIDLTQWEGWVCAFIGLAKPDSGFIVSSASELRGSPTQLDLTGATVGQLLIGFAAWDPAVSVGNDLTTLLTTDAQAAMGYGYATDSTPLLTFTLSGTGGSSIANCGVVIQGNTPVSTGIFYL